MEIAHRTRRRRIGDLPGAHHTPVRAVVVVASRHGSTFGIARALRDGLESEGLDATLFVADSFDSFEGADAVVLGSAVYTGRWLDSAESLLHRNASELSELPVWLFSSSPVGDRDGADPIEPIGVGRAAGRIGARDHRMFRGTLDMAMAGDAECISLWAGSIASELMSEFSPGRQERPYIEVGN